MNSSSSKEMKRYNLLHGEIEATYHDASLRFGISDSVSKILYAICSSGDSITLSDICRNTGLTKQTVNSSIRKLEGVGMICLEAVDRKAKKVRLTEDGKLFAGKTAARLIEIENAVFAAWPDDDVQKYLELTERYLTELKERIRLL